MYQSKKAGAEGQCGLTDCTGGAENARLPLQLVQKRLRSSPAGASFEV